MFRKIFADTISSITGDLNLADTLWQDIASHYSSADRYYHNLSHLDHIANELLPVRDKIVDWVVVVFAVAYHDIIYNILKKDNEEKSAAFAGKALKDLLDPESLEKSKQMILATKNHTQSADPDINHFTDADLSIPGAGEKKYDLYTKQIRKEYGYYPDVIYQAGRRSVLRRFLDMDRIYKSAWFYDKFENQARKNLSKEYDKLT